MNVKLIAKTTPNVEMLYNDIVSIEDLIVYAARVSNPTNQLNMETKDKLLRYCWRHKHWSIFETASITMEIETSRAIAAQILRHRSFTFQEFSQRYAKSTEFEPIELRRQDTKNRQNSTNDLDQVTKFVSERDIEEHLRHATHLYNKLLKKGVAKECARMILPLTTQTRLYMTGNLRSWLTYCMTRCEASTQKEHRDIAIKCWEIIKELCPSIAMFVEEEHSYLRKAA